MAWACTDCGRTYDDPPAACSVCGADVVPAGGSPSGPSRISLTAARQRLLDPFSAETSLVDVDPRVRFAFRVLVGITLVLLAVVVGALIFG